MLMRERKNDLKYYESLAWSYCNERRGQDCREKGTF